MNYNNKKKNKVEQQTRDGGSKNDKDKDEKEKEEEEEEEVKCVSEAKDKTLHVTVQAKPGAKDSAITELSEVLGVRLAAPPREGAANEELVTFLAQVLGIKSRDVTLQSGSKSRSKVVVICGISKEEAIRKFKQALLNS